MRTALIRVQVASAAHRFTEARALLEEIEALDSQQAAAQRLSLAIDQACGGSPNEVLKARRQMAAESGRLEDLTPLGALLADLHEFDEADQVYLRALREYDDVSPFALGWVCFQLGVLWGEQMPESQPVRAARWYRKAIEYLPCYVKARVHLSEIVFDSGEVAEAESLLLPAISSGDPETHWRLADILVKMRRPADAEIHMQAAREGFELLLRKHPLAFADHAAEFYSGSGGDGPRALELSAINVANRPTLRAFEQTYETALRAGEEQAAHKIAGAARKRWGRTAAFKSSPLATVRIPTEDRMEEEHDDR